MKKAFLVGLVVVLAVAINVATPASQTRVAVEQTLLDRTATGDDVRVIVGVAARFVPEGDLPGPDVVAAQRSGIAQALQVTMARAAAAGVPVGRAFETIPFFTATVNRAQLEALAATPGVSTIGEDMLLKPTLNVSTGLINAPAAWAAGHTGAGWGVAVLDTGVDTTHSFLAGRVVTQACYSSTQPAMGGGPATVSFCPGGVNSNTTGGGNCPANVEGCDHGTHVAGIAAGFNGPGGANGVAPGASIHAIQVFSRVDSSAACSPGTAPCTTAWTSDVILGLQRVLALRNAGHPIAAVNMSLGGGSFTGANCDAQSSQIATKAAIDNLLAAGVATVIASGNDSLGGAIAGPACISTAVAVGATTRGICPGSPLCPGGAAPGLPNVPVFSNHSIAVDLLAPGVGINSSVPGNSFSAFNGTSMATPHVAGAWAVLKQAVPAATPAVILAALTATGTQITEPFTGIPKPLINLNNARLVLLGAAGSAPGAPTSFTVNVVGNAVSGTWVAPASGGAPTTYQLLVRAAPGGPIVATLPLGLATSFGPIAAPNGAYTLSVRAGNASGFGPESNAVSITVPSLGARPGNPTNLTASVAGNSATFNWVAPTSGGPVANYVLLASNAPFPAPALASLTLAPSPTMAMINGIPPGVWYIRIFARNAAGNSDFSTNQVQITVAGPAPPAAPTLNAPIVSAGNTVGLSWSASAGATSYTLVVRLAPAGPAVIVASLGAVTAVSFPGVPNGTYYLQVVANNAVGSSPPSNQVTLVVP